MARQKKQPVQNDFMDEIIANVPKDEILSMELNTLEDYISHNQKARVANKKLGMCRYKMRQCPEELHPTQRVRFNRNDQPGNPLPVYISNDMIEFKKTLIPGKEYDLPECVIDHLSEKGVPVWKWVDNPDGSKETQIASKNPRFSLRTVFAR